MTAASGEDGTAVLCPHFYCSTGGLSEKVTCLSLNAVHRCDPLTGIWFYIPPMAVFFMVLSEVRLSCPSLLCIMVDSPMQPKHYTTLSYHRLLNRECLGGNVGLHRLSTRSSPGCVWACE